MAKTYVKPEKDKYIYTCPHCNTLSQMQRDTHYFDNDIEVENYGMRIIYNELTIHRCQCCERKMLCLMNYIIIVPILNASAS